MVESESLYNELLSGNPSPETLYRVLSRMKHEGMAERVTEECVKALERYPDDIRIRRLLAEAYFETGRISEAESEIGSVIARVNDLMGCYRFQADLLISQGKRDEAVEALKLYMIHRPDDSEAYALLETMMPAPAPVETSLTEEEQAPDEGADEIPDIATATLAEVYFSQGLTREAIGIYKKVVERNPDDAASRARLDELEALSEQARLDKERERDVLARKRRLVAIMESWLDGIRQQARPGLYAG